MKDKNIETIAEEIKKVSDSIKALKNGPLEERAIIVLLHDYTGLPKNVIKKVLSGAEDLAQFYLKEEP